MKEGRPIVRKSIAVELEELKTLRLVCTNPKCNGAAVEMSVSGFIEDTEDSGTTPIRAIPCPQCGKELRGTQSDHPLARLALGLKAVIAASGVKVEFLLPPNLDLQKG